MKTLNYITMEEVKIQKSPMSSLLTLPKGSFVRPIEYVYIPKHIIDNPMWRFFDKQIDVFCYTRFGIVPIEKKLLRPT